MDTLIVLKATHRGREKRFSTEDFDRAFDIMKKIEYLKNTGVKIFYSMGKNTRGVAETIGNSLKSDFVYAPLLNPPLDFSDIEALIFMHQNEVGTIILVGDSHLISFVDFYASHLGIKGATHEISKIGGYILGRKGRNFERIKGKRK